MLTVESIINMKIEKEKDIKRGKRKNNNNYIYRRAEET